MAAYTRWTYQVRGSVSFPIDMLRYDCCWPLGEADDAHTIERCIRHETIGTSVVTVRGVKPPTERRWSSMGWHVDPARHRGGQSGIASELHLLQ